MLIKLLSKSRILPARIVTLNKVVNSIKSNNNQYFAFGSSSFQSIRQLTDRRYSKKHEWVSVDLQTSNVGTVGISNYAQEALGDVVYVQLPDVDSLYDQNDEVGAVESVKAASEIYSPVSGKITQVNSLLEEQPGLVNSSCYDKGWLYKIELTKPEEVENLMNEDAYNKYLKSIKED